MTSDEWNELAERIAALSVYVDDYEPNRRRDREAALWGRVMKVVEEAGEVTEALIGATDQNPRKGQSHTMADVTEELLDVAVSALGAVEHIHGNSGASLAMMAAHVDRRYERAGLDG